VVRTGWFWIGFVAVLHTVAGFWIAPWAGKKVLIDTIRDKLGREARLASLRFNPYTLAVTAKGFSLQDADGGDLVRFEELYANFQVSSLFRWGLTFNQVRLLLPFARLELRRDGTWNFSDLPSSSASPPWAEAPGTLIRLLIQDLQLEGGRLDFADRARVSLSSVQARTLWRYVRDRVPFEIRDGLLGVQSEHALSLAGGNIDPKLSNAGVTLDNLRLGFPGEEADLAALLALGVEGASFDLPGRRLHVPRVSLRAGGLKIRRDARGDLDWMRLAPTRGASAEEPGAPAAPRAPGFQVRIDEVRTDDFSVAFTDASTRPEAAMEASSIATSPSGTSTAPPGPCWTWTSGSGSARRQTRR